MVKKFLVKKLVKKILGPKKCLAKKNFKSKFLFQKKFWSQKNFEYEKFCWVPKNLGSMIFFGPPGE